MREQIIFVEVSNRGESLRQAWSGNMVFELESRVTIDPLETFSFGKSNHKGDVLFCENPSWGESQRPRTGPTEVPGRKESRYGGSFLGTVREEQEVHSPYLSFCPPQRGRQSPGTRFVPIDVKKKQCACDMMDCVVTDAGSFKRPGTKGFSNKEKQEKLVGFKAEG